MEPSSKQTERLITITDAFSTLIITYNRHALSDETIATNIAPDIKTNANFL